jgi:CubicO group peptidase (beta-lactamase class C family)
LTGLDTLLDDPPPVHLAVAVSHHGQVVAERYGDDPGPYLSWSMAKSITHALVGILVRQGRIDIHAPAAVPEWAGDDRRAITVDQLLRMSSGLKFVEDYVDERISDVINMLFGDGQGDVAGFAAAFPLEHPPDTVWNYSSGTTNIVCRIIGDIVGDVSAFVTDELFRPLGMDSATIRCDERGTFIGSSFVYATARDYLKFGRLYLTGEPAILPAGWIDYARTPRLEPTYGAHWWIGEDLFYAAGYEGQYIYVVPHADLVVTRLGKTPAEQRPAVEAWIGEIIGCFS